MGGTRMNEDVVVVVPPVDGKCEVGSSVMVRAWRASVSWRCWWDSTLLHGDGGVE